MAPRETEINAYAKFWGDKQRVLLDVMVFSEVVIKGNDLQVLKLLIVKQIPLVSSTGNV